MNIDSIIFDLDGTLWNSIEGISGTWKKVLSKYPNIKRVVTIKDIEGYMGLPISDIGKKLFPDLDSKDQMELMKECSELGQKYLGKHGGKLYPKLEDTLKILSNNYKLFLVSNCAVGYIQCFFKAHKLEKYFTDIECNGVTGLSKGENNKLIIQRNKLENPIYIGDANVDAESAKVAGIPFVYARYGLGNVEKYDYVIDSFEEILDLVIE